jgi:replicative DNA helicase
MSEALSFQERHTAKAELRSYEDTATSAADAMVGMELGEEDFIHFPWPSLDRAVGGVGPNRIVILAAPPEGGKSSFMLSLLDGWAEDGVRVCAGFLETPTDVLMQQWACLRLGINYEIIGTGAYLTMRNAREIRESVKNEISHMAIKFSRTIWPHPMTTLSAATLDAFYNDAFQFDADVAIIDHLDHTEDTGNGASGITLSNTIISTVHRRMRQAKARGSKMRTFATSQMNNDATRRGGVFGRATPPIPSDVFMGQRKEQLADLFLGLHRIRRPAMEGDVQLEKDVKEGRRPLADMLLPNTVGVRIMKRRVGGGSNITIPLGFRAGRVVEPNYTMSMVRAADTAPAEVFES